VQTLLPGSIVVKAFNTLGSEIMIDPSLAGGPVTVPLAGDDRDAKGRVATLVRDAGLEPMDMGPLSLATFIEGMLGLYVSYRRYNPGQGFEFYLRPMPDIINSGR
jgi:predicted dinucleotide-binding enzyme